MTFACRFDLARRPILCGGSDGIALPAPVDESDLRALVDWQEDQQNSEGCVGEGLECATYLARPNRQGSRTSPRGWWRHARFREKARRSDPIQNVGCDPYDAIDAGIAIGIYARDARDDDPAQWNAGETLYEAEHSILFLPEHFLYITPGDVDTVDAVLTMGCGVFCFSSVDAAYESLAADAIWPGLTGPSIGGHAECIIGHSKPGAWYRKKGSWGAGFSDGGCARMSRAFVASGQVGLVGVVGAPIIP